MRPVSPRTKPRERERERTDSLSDVRAFFFSFLFFCRFFHFVRFFSFIIFFVSSEIFCRKNVKICVSFLCVFVLGGLSLLRKEYTRVRDESPPIHTKKHRVECDIIIAHEDIRTCYSTTAQQQQQQQQNHHV